MNCKIISHYYEPEQAEYAFNIWLNEHPHAKIHHVSYTTNTSQNGLVRHSILIVYDECEDIKI